MDNGSIIAIITVDTTGLVTLFSKWIDSKQKADEHKLSLHSVYVSKKIEAGQKFIGENNVRLSSKINIKMYLLSLKDYKRDYGHLLSRHKIIENKLVELSIDANNFVYLYYNIEPLDEKLHLLLNKLNETLPLIEPGGNYCQDEDYDENVDKAIECINELLSVYHTMNKLIREDLAKYDTL